MITIIFTMTFSFFQNIVGDVLYFLEELNYSIQRNVQMDMSEKPASYLQHLHGDTYLDNICKLQMTFYLYLSLTKGGSDIDI